MAKYEIEIKTLLGKEDAKQDLIRKMKKTDPEFRRLSKNNQLNHYFAGSNINELYEKVEAFLPNDRKSIMKEIIEAGNEFSVRTRKKDSDVYLVIKASVDEGTSENTVSRLEFEEKIDLTLDEIDSLILEVGYTYQAKWSRERSEYTYKKMNVCIDKNAGYGYVAEFEKVIDDEKKIPQAKSEIKRFMEELGLEELPQDRLGRMFDHYNKNWEKYYGTNKTFTIK